MGRALESFYFPSLEECLQGGKLLISWRTVLTALTHPDSNASDHKDLEAFLTDPYVKQSLARPFNPFSKPAPQTKSLFDTRTAAINITPTSNSCYNINEIKEDALWLSKEANFDEVSALRIVVLEYQSRSSSQLLCDFTVEEAASLQEASGNINTETSNLVPRTLLSCTTNSGDQTKSFETQESRRIRGLRLYLSERRNLLKCSEILIRTALDQNQTQAQVGDKGKGKEIRGSLIDRVGASLIKDLSAEDRGYNKFLVACVEAVRVDIGLLNQGSGWFKEEGYRESLELDWLSNQIIQATHTMEILLWVLDAQKLDNPRSSMVVTGWYQFVSSYGFFDDFQPPHPTMVPLVSALQSLVATICLALIDPYNSMAYLDEAPADGGALAGNGHTPYISDMDTVSELHGLLVDAAIAVSPIASPAILAWTVILQDIRATSSSRKEARELRQSQRAVEGFEDELSMDEEGVTIEPAPKLRRRTSASSEISLETGIYEDILERIMDVQIEEDPIEFLGRSAVDGCRVFDVLATLASTGPDMQSRSGVKIRNIVLESVRFGLGMTGYVPEIMNTVLATLNAGQNYWDVVDREQTVAFDHPLATFLQDDGLRQSFLDAAKSRYPYERLPFLKLIRAVAACQLFDDDGTLIAARILENIPSFTYILPANFKDYETTQEEDNTNTVRLTQAVELFEPRSMKLSRGLGGTESRSLMVSQDSNDLCIPAGTHGRIVSETGPKVAVWFHEYSGLKYMGKLLETALTAGEFVDATTRDVVDRDSAIEIIGLFASLLNSGSKLEQAANGAVDPHGSTHRILEEASDGLSRNRDIITVIFALFEEELQRQSEGAGQEIGLELLVVSIQFIHSLVPILPGRVWPLLGRSGLLDLDGRGGKLTSLLAGVELVVSRYDFVLSCMHLLNALVEDTATNAVSRKNGGKQVVKAGSREDSGTGVPTAIVVRVLQSFTRTAVDIYGSSCNWKYAVPEQRLSLSKLLSGIFDRVLHYTYGVDDISEPNAKLIGGLATAAQHICDTFLSSSFGHLRFQPILRGLIDGFSTPDTTFHSYSDRVWQSHVTGTLNICTTLIRLSTVLGRPTSHLETQLFRVSPLVARLYAVSTLYQAPVVTLLEALVVSVANGTEEPPSLLGHLGPQTSKNFLHMLLDLGKPLDNDEHAIGIWRLMSSVVSNRQQWFAIYLLTGRTPRDTLKNDGKNQAGGATTKPLLKTALDALVDIKNLPQPRALAMLEFISLAQNFWPWAMSDLQKQSQFITSISDFASTIESVPRSAKDERSIDGCYRIRMGGYIAEILAMYLYHSRQIGNLEPAKEILTKVEFFKESAVVVPSYKSSLHGNLKRNFENRFPGCTLQDFKRTRLEPRSFGSSYFYDLKLADRMLTSDSAWTGKKGDGLAHELVQANINLSLVDSQVALLHGWKMLAIELTNYMTNDVRAQNMLMDVAKNCLIANGRTRLPETIFVQLSETRADLALVILQRLIEVGCKEETALALLPTSWNLIMNHDESFEQAMTSGDASYYRTLLKLLFLALRFHAGRKPGPKVTTVSQLKDLVASGVSAPKDKDEAEEDEDAANDVDTDEKGTPSQIGLQIIDKIVAQGFRDLVRAIHEKLSESVPEDLALITAILQACLLIPGIQFCHPQILSVMTKTEAPRLATTLFSWSDKLAVEGDPIYGELSMLFLLELSSIPQLAEQLAIEGVLGHISSANITGYIRRANVSPLADGAGPQRCYSIWVKAILPLLLNILDAVGSSIAVEVALFLNQFPNLLKQSTAAFESQEGSRTVTQSKYLTYTSVSEVHSLSLILFILSTFRDQMMGITDVPDVQWDGAAVIENVEFWLNARVVLRERILPLGPREAEMAKQKPLSGALKSQNRLEEKIVEELEGIKVVLSGN